jgi:hypothetical protein
LRHVINDKITSISWSPFTDVDSLSFAFHEVNAKNLAQLLFIPLPVDEEQRASKGIDDGNK